ncbi:MAG: TolC family protein [Planctomycetes bacterium]|nr:TolC family protein [Planctomycetota bacterium]
MASYTRSARIVHSLGVLSAFCAITSLVWIGGCVSERVGNESLVTNYQRQLALAGPQARHDVNAASPEESLDLLTPAPTDEPPVPDLAIAADPNTGEKTVPLTLEQAITLSLANSPEIRVLSFDPEIARQGVIAAVGDFDATAFSRINYEDQDSPQNSIFEAGQAETRLFESGVKQKTPLGTEWSASYALARIWDDLFGRTLPTRYEPAVIFEIKQPLLRDAWDEVNLAGVNIAKLNYEASLLGFRERAEAVSSAVTVAYWRLVQARKDLQVQQQLVQQTDETLRKVEGRRDIDATDVQIKQAQAYALSRRAALLEQRKRVVDVQDTLARLIADPRINTTSELQIAPATEPQAIEELPELAAATDRALATAMKQNPQVQRAQLGVEVARINVEVAQNQKMPRLDLVASTRARGLARDHIEAHDQIEGVDYTSYAVGLTFEYPLGNRQREAEWMRRKLERRKAVSTLHSTADEVAISVKESVRRVRTSIEEARIQQAAVEAAGAHLATLEQAEQIRDKLTPEFLLVKLQAQETYAQSQRARTAALIELNVAAAELAQHTGTILDLRMVQSSLTTVVDTVSEQNKPPEPEKPQGPRTFPPRSPSL